MALGFQGIWLDGQEGIIKAKIIQYGLSWIQLASLEIGGLRGTLESQLPPPP